eukprot:5989-Heterococcus_DN1.PRE.2
MFTAAFHTQNTQSSSCMQKHARNTSHNRHCELTCSTNTLTRMHCVASSLERFTCSSSMQPQHCSHKSYVLLAVTVCRCNYCSQLSSSLLSTSSVSECGRCRKCSQELYTGVVVCNSSLQSAVAEADKLCCARNLVTIALY